jgi:hypothetical protein
MATGRKTGGRRKGTPNKATAERQAAIAASGISPLDIMVENARWAHEQAVKLTEQLAHTEQSLETTEVFVRMMRFRELAVEWAHLAAPYVHPRVAAVAHRHTNADGRPAKPIVNVFIHRNPRPEGAGLSEPGDNIPDRRQFDDLVGERQRRLPLVRSP